MNPTTLALIFAILSPILFAIMNLLDKFVVSRKVRKPLGFTILAGFANLIFGVILALFLNWDRIGLNDLLFPAISGALFGSQFFIYYLIMKKEDASNLIGLYYVYPLFVALFSFIFLNEKLSLIGYLGMLLIIIGALSLSLKIHKLNGKKTLLLIFITIIIVSVYEFLIKVITNNLPVWNGISLEFIFIGITISFGLFSKNIRQGVYSEIKNLKWAFLTETFTLLGVVTTFLAMTQLKATVVASIAAIQPLAVLFLEIGASKFIRGIRKDKSILNKLIPITLIIIGVIILSWIEIV